MTVPHRGSGWRLAPALIAAEAEADRIAPRRRRTSDGSIGDAAHRARPSDHNPSGGWVHALDLSHDPAGGFDAHAHARQIAARRDPRIKYLISNRQIWNPSVSPHWRPYTGPNGHTSHVHISLRATDAARNDTSPWFGAAIPFPSPPTTTEPTPRPVPQEHDDMIMRHHHNGEIWLYDGGGLTRSHVPTWDHVGALKTLGVPYDDVSGNAIYSQVLLDVTRDIDRPIPTA